MWEAKKLPLAPTVYLAGAQTQHALELTVNQPVLETFAEIRPIADAYRPLWSHRMIDSGAYSAHMRGAEIDIGEYREFIEERGRLYNAIANLDVISDWRASMENWAKLKHLNAFPVFHEGEPWELLEEMTLEQSKSPPSTQAGWVGIGCQRPMVRGRIIMFLEECRSHIVGNVKVHGFGLTGYTSVLDFDSVDSTTWLLGLQMLMSINELRHLTRGELIEIQLARMQRSSFRDEWDLNWRETTRNKNADQLRFDLGD